MSRLTELIRQVRTNDPQLADDLASEIKTLGTRRAFGLNFERHTPETVELPGRPVRKGDKVRFLAERGEDPRSVDQRLWRVTEINKNDAQPSAKLVGQDPNETKTRTLENLVVVAEFGDAVYPGLQSTGSVQRGGNKPFHAVINSENFHALQALLYTHEGQVDAIYIDPPYNTGNRDWKYNNNYVDNDDAYRHSKWLAFMERRLKLAKKLLNPDNSILMVTIDEKEVHRLALLVSQVFPGSRTQMVSTLTNPKGVARGQEFYRVDEYILFVFIGAATVTKTSDPMILTGKRNIEEDDEKTEAAKAETPKKIRWGNLLRSGTDAKRTDRKWQFYPIFLDSETGALHSVGEPLLPVTAPRDSIEPPHGTLAVWPIRKDGSEGRWQVSNETLRGLFASGFASIGRFRGNDRVSFSYVTENIQSQISTGKVEIVGRDDNGVVLLEYAADTDVSDNPKTMWNKTSHSASEYGSTLLRMLLPGRSFPFPKSLYAVEDALRFFVKKKPDALVLDFFGGSGTTAHALMRLNRQDGGRRRAIVVTNNEVSADEQVELRSLGLRPGDEEWERLGICDYITKPRLAAAITGRTPSGDLVKGSYKFIDEFPMAEGFEENIEFFTLTYEAPRTVAHNRAFEVIAPLLWLKAGSQGRRIEKATDTFDVADAYGVLFDLDSSHEFLEAVQATQSLAMAFIVTDDERSYQMICSELPKRVKPVRLYESYLTNFTINTGRE